MFLCFVFVLLVLSCELIVSGICAGQKLVSLGPVKVSISQLSHRKPVPLQRVEVDLGQVNMSFTSAQYALIVAVASTNFQEEPIFLKPQPPSTFQALHRHHAPVSASDTEGKVKRRRDENGDGGDDGGGHGDASHLADGSIAPGDSELVVEVKMALLALELLQPSIVPSPVEVLASKWLFGWNDPYVFVFAKFGLNRRQRALYMRTYNRVLVNRQHHS
jgi:hypothetical protein